MLNFCVRSEVGGKNVGLFLWWLETNDGAYGGEKATKPQIWVELFFFFLKKTGRNGKENLSCLSLMEFFRCSFTKTETVWQLDLRFCCFFEGATQAKLAKTHHPQNSWNLSLEGLKTSKNLSLRKEEMGRCVNPFAPKKREDVSPITEPLSIFWIFRLLLVEADWVG